MVPKAVEIIRPYASHHGLFNRLYKSSDNLLKELMHLISSIWDTDSMHQMFESIFTDLRKVLKYIDRKSLIKRKSR